MMRNRIVLVAVSVAVLGLCSVPATAHPAPTPTHPQRLWHPGTNTGPAATSATAGPSGWQVEPSPNPTTSSGYLKAVSCAGPSACIAVGWFENATGDVATFAEHRDGTAWTLQVTPNPDGAPQAFLQGVSCVSPRFCVAVGYYFDGAGSIHNLAERWDGTAWTLSPVADPSGAQGTGLFGVSCPSTADCWAVGTYNTAAGRPVTLAEHWTGGWQIRPSANPAGALAAQLSAVSCDGARSCSATGSYVDAAGTQRPLADSRDGGTWTVEPAPDPTGSQSSDLAGVSCPAAGACVAVGHYSTADGSGAAFAESRDAATSTWTLRPVAQAANASLEAVSCATVNACTAVGGDADGARAERWNGLHWNVETPGTSRFSGFTGDSCTGARACVAAGFDVAVQHYPKPLVDTWDGVTWYAQVAPAPRSSTESVSLAVACTDAGGCTSVGFNTAPSDRSKTLAERWSPSWTIQTTASPASPDSALDGVSCPSRTYCLAAGYYFTAAQSDAPLSESWDGHTWTIRATPVPTGATGSELRAVSCSAANHCVAVGAYDTSDGSQFGFAERWDGTAWHLQHVAGVTGATGSELVGVACTSGTACTAVGDYADGHGRQRVLAEVWNGTAWRVEHTPAVAGAQAAGLTSVACTAATTCTAAGRYIDTRGDTDTLVEIRRGASWSVRPSPNQPGAVSTSLAGVACLSNTSCVAVGNEYALGPTGHPLPPTAFAEAWDGSTWRIEAVATLAGTNSSLLTGVSCAPARCHAVGYVFASSGHQVTYAVGARAGG